MKLSTKLLAAALTLMMVVALAVPALAETPTHTEITAEDNYYDILVKTDKEDRIYEAYHIFGGDVADVTQLDPSGTEEIVRRYLTNIVWGDAFDEAAQKGLSTWYFSNMDFENEEAPEIYDAKVIAENVINHFSGKELAAIFANYMGAPQATADSDDFDVVAPGYTLRVTKPGYYLVREQKDSLDGEHASATWFLLSTLDPENVTVLEPKVPTDPEVDKFVTDEENFVSENYGWNDRAYAELGETVYFCLDAKFPFNGVDETGWTAHSFEDYEVYPFTFSDLHPAGLTLNQDSFKVYTNNYFGEEVDPSLYTVELIAGKDGGYRINVHFDDLSEIVAKRAPDADAGEQFPVVLESLQVIYTATVNKNALVPEGTDWEEDDSTTGNINSVYATYPNDPNHPEEEDGQTPSAEAEVFTFMLEVNKVDEGGNPLDGAKFVLYDGAAMKYLVYDLANVTIEWVDDVNAATVFTSSTTTDDSDTVVTAGYFRIKGLAPSENYELVEIEAPLGYNRLESSVFFPIGVEDSTNANVTIVNKKGLVLPSTGGIGTTVLYAVGAILLIGSGVVVVTRRRVAK